MKIISRVYQKILSDKKIFECSDDISIRYSENVIKIQDINNINNSTNNIRIIFMNKIYSPWNEYLLNLEKIYPINVEYYYSGIFYITIKDVYSVRKWKLNNIL